MIIFQFPQKKIVGFICKADAIGALAPNEAVKQSMARILNFGAQISFHFK
jgi:hypothetical protein